MPLESALRLLLKDLDLTYMIRGESVLITTPEEVEANLVTRFSRVPSVLADRTGRRWVDTLTSCVAPDSWEDVGGPGALDVCGDLFIVSQTEEVQQEIAVFLSLLEHAVEHCRDETNPADVLAAPVDFERRALGPSSPSRLPSTSITKNLARSPDNSPSGTTCRSCSMCGRSTASASALT